MFSRLGPNRSTRSVSDVRVLTLLANLCTKFGVNSEFCCTDPSMNALHKHRLLALLVFYLFSHYFAAAQKNSKDADAAFFVQLETDYAIQTVLFESRSAVLELERAGVLPEVARQLRYVPSRPEPEDCIERYLAESVAKAWIDSALFAMHGDAWVGQPCRERFLASSLYDQVETSHPGVLREISLEFRELARMQGISVASVWFISEFAQIAAITVLTASGLGELALLAPVVPLSFVNTGIAIQVKAMKHANRVKRGYGGSENKRLARKTEKQLSRKLHLNYKSSLLTGFGTRVNDTLQLVAVQDPSISSRIFRGGRGNGKRMYFGKLRGFMKDEGLLNSSCGQVLDRKLRTRRMNTLLALRCMHDHEPKVFANFLERYPDLAIEVPADEWLSSAADRETKEWVYYLLSRKYPEELRDGLARIPRTLTVREVSDLLERLVYPYWARNMKRADFKVFRRMVKGTRSFIYASLREQNRNWNFGYTQRLLTECRLNDFGG